MFCERSKPRDAPWLFWRASARTSAPLMPLVVSADLVARPTPPFVVPALPPARVPRAMRGAVLHAALTRLAAPSQVASWARYQKRAVLRKDKQVPWEWVLMDEVPLRP